MRQAVKRKKEIGERKRNRRKARQKQAEEKRDSHTEEKDTNIRKERGRDR